MDNKLLLQLIYLGLAAWCGHATCQAQVQDQTLRAVAVLDFDVPSRREESVVLRELIEARLSAGVPVVTRTKLDAALRELGLTASGLVAPERAVEAGKISGAHTLITGGVYDVGTARVVTLQAITTETGRSQGVNVVLPAKIDRSGTVDKIVQTIDQSLVRWQQTPPPLVADTQDEGDASRPLVAVLNFDSLDAADPEWSWLSIGLADLTMNLLSSQKVRVVSRDNLQRLVRELAIPKMQDQSPRIMKMLLAKRAVHGVYRITGDQIQLQLSLVNAVDPMPIHTVTVTGRLDELFALLRRSVAEIIDVHFGRRVGTIDPQRLPSWTEQLNAAQSLYRGVELFDRGKYLEAWLLFRRAQQVEPQYADAAYWSGRMMYYVQEYHQSRHDLTRFLAIWPQHPRAGDAGLEVVHSVQSSGAAEPEVIDTLAMVGRLAPLAEVANFDRSGMPTLLGFYVDAVSAQIHASRKRFRAAAESLARHLHLVPPTHQLYHYAWELLYDLRWIHLQDTGDWFEIPPGPEYTLKRQLAQSPGGRHPLSFSTKQRDILGMFALSEAEADRRTMQPIVQLTANQPTRSWSFPDDPLQLGAVDAERGFKAVAIYTYTHYIVAPPGHYIVSLEVEVQGEEIDNKFEFLKVEHADLQFKQGTNVTGKIPLSEPNRLRYLIQPLPGTRYVPVRVGIHHRSPYPKDIPKRGRVIAWNCKANLARFEAGSGTLIVQQPAGLEYKTLLDLPYYVLGVSQIGLGIPVGEHRAFTAFARYASQAANVRVSSFRIENDGATVIQPRAENLRVVNASAQKMTQEVSCELHTSPDIHHAGIGATGDEQVRDAASVTTCEDQRGRLIAVWSVRRDLFLAISEDRGRSWSPSRQLSLPVNSAHQETAPCLTQSQDGRYVLAFLSDRGLARTNGLYVCWSDDLQEFSAPRMVTSAGGAPQRILQRADGVFLLYARAVGEWARTRSYHLWSERGWAVFMSTDLAHWSSPIELPVRNRETDFVVTGNQVEAFESAISPGSRIPPTADISTTPLFRTYVSDDGVQFRMKEQVVVNLPNQVQDREFHVNDWIRSLRVQQVNGELYLFANRRFAVICRREQVNTWQAALEFKNRFWGDVPQTDCIHFTGNDGFVRILMGRPRWVPYVVDDISGRTRVEVVALPQFTATRFNVNLRELVPDPQGKAEGLSPNQLHLPLQVEVLTTTSRAQ